MRLKSFTINNYRGAKLAENIPIKLMSVFVGKNDSGKSIVLNAVATFLNIKDYPILDIDFNNPEDPISFDGHFTADNLKEAISKKIGTKIKKDEGKEEFINDVCAQDEIAIRRIITKAGKAFDKTLIRLMDYDHEDLTLLYQKSDEEITKLLEKYKINIPVSGAGRNSKLEKIKHIKQYCVENEISTKVSWTTDDYEIAKLLPEIELFKSDYGIEADTAFKTSSVTEIKDVIDEECCETGKLTEVAKKIEQEMGKESDAIATLMKEYVPNVKSVAITPNFTWKDAIKSVDVNFEFDNDSKPINMTRKGSGYRRLFMVARFRYIAQKKKGNNILYAIEEPETFLHPSAQEDLLSALSQLSSENQILLATHSPIFAGSSDRSAVVLCEKTGSGSKYTTEEDNEDIPKRIIEELGIRPHHNLRDNYTKILFCESKNDILFYDAISRAVLGKGLVNEDSILALPGGGDSLEDIINIDYFTKTGRDIYLLADSDKHLDQNTQDKNIKRVDRFETLDRAKGYLLKKACIENYYHPRAFERIYGDIPKGKCEIFADADNVRAKLKLLTEETGVQIKHKNEHRVFSVTTKKEWEEIVEDELIVFLNEVTS
jgi:predicted ATP-dependent endonuclease of OLD family